jgi:toxin ParE1/3/4
VKVIWAPLALDRAAEIARYIAADRPSAAERWIDGLVRLAAGLSRAPRRGRIVPEVARPDLREILYGRYRLIYRLDPKRVVVLTVRHARRAFDVSELEGRHPEAAT